MTRLLALSASALLTVSSLAFAGNTSSNSSSNSSNGVTTRVDTVVTDDDRGRRVERRRISRENRGVRSYRDSHRERIDRRSRDRNDDDD